MAQGPDAITRWWHRISLRAKVTGVTVAVLTLGLFLAGVGTAPILRSSLIDNIDNQFPALIASNLPERWFTISATDGALSFQPNPTAPRLADYSFAIYAADGAFLATAGRQSAGAPAFPSRYSLEQATARAGAAPFAMSGHDGSLFHVTAVVGESNGEYFVQLVALPLEEADRIVGTFFGVYTTVALITVLLAALLIRGLVTLTFRRLGQVESTAMAIASGDFSQRLTDLEPSTEVGRLNFAINTMLERVDASLEQRERTVLHMRRFIGDASHELRTPLVSVRGYAELYRMGAISSEDDVARAMERIEKEAIRMGVLVEDLLVLARLDEQPELHIEPLDLRPIAHDAALDVQAASPDRSVTVIDRVSQRAAVTAPTRAIPISPNVSDESDTADDSGAGWTIAGAALGRLRRRPRRDDAPITQPIQTVREEERPALPVVLGEENKVRQVIANLLGNARRFSPDGSPIELVVDADRASGMATIAVVDHGIGIPPQQREQIFERFWRADSSRARETGGSGLGLAIVSSIVSVLGGTVRAEQTPGGGATFVVALPLARAEDIAAANQDAPDE